MPVSNICMSAISLIESANVAPICRAKNIESVEFATSSANALTNCIAGEKISEETAVSFKPFSTNLDTPDPT